MLLLLMICFDYSKTFSYFYIVFLFKQNLIPSWNHDGDPIESLHATALMARFRQQLKDDPKFLQNKVKKYFKVELENDD